MEIEVYTDGSATTADKPGGWAYVITLDGEFHSEGSGHAENVTNNDMELEAAIQGLTAARTFVLLKNLSDYRLLRITLVSDSQLILGWANGTYQFKQASKIEKYKELRFMVGLLHVKTRWVRGHSGNPFNERCDELANLARTGVDKSDKKRKTHKIGDKTSGVMCIWYKNVLKVIDLDGNIVEDFDETTHGSRSSALQLQG